MCESIYSRRSCEPPWHVHHKVHIDYGHIGHELIVGKRVLYTSLLVCYDGKWCDLTSSSGGRRNSYEVRLFSHLGEGVDPLPYVHEPHCKVVEVHLRMFVQCPHYLSGVHGGSASDGDYHVGLELLHGLGSQLCTGKRRVRSYVEERIVGYVHLV